MMSSFGTPSPRVLVYSLSLLGLSWFGMMAVHEAGHVTAAYLTGGHVERVVLHPAAISRTDVSPNPRPAIVVWAGPLTGILLPLAFAAGVPRGWAWAKGNATFFAGFCLVTNGAYIGFGTPDGVGDCGEMLRTGSPRWLLYGFAALTIPAGLLLWHRLGSPRQLLSSEAAIPARAAWGTALALTVVVLAGLLLSPS